MQSRLVCFRSLSSVLGSALALVMATLSGVALLTGCQTAPAQAADAGPLPDTARLPDLIAHLPSDQAAYFHVNVAANRELVTTVLQAFTGGSGTLDLFLERTDILVGSIDGEPDQRRIFAVAGGGYPVGLVELLLAANSGWERSEERIWRSADSAFQFRFLSDELVYSSNGDLSQLARQIEHEATAGLPRAVLLALPAHEATLYVRHPERGFESRILGRVQPIRDWIAFVDRRSDGEREISGWIRMETADDARRFVTLLRLILGALALQLELDSSEALGELQVERDEARIYFSGARVSSTQASQLATLLAPQP